MPGRLIGFNFTTDLGLRKWNRTPSPTSSACLRTHPTSEIVLLCDSVAGTLVWGIEWLVKRVLTNVPIPCRCCKGELSVHPAILLWGHSLRLTAHPRVRGTLEMISQRFWWPTRARDVHHFIMSCPVCAQAKSSDYPPSGLLKPLPISSGPWSHIALDFVTGLPPSAGNTFILMVNDSFSKAAQFVLLPKLTHAKETTRLAFNHDFKIHGLPSDVISDREPQFACFGGSPAGRLELPPVCHQDFTHKLMGRLNE